MPSDRCNTSFEDIISLVVGELDPAAAARLQTHLAAGCDRCQANLAWAERVIGRMKADTSEVPPLEGLRRARSIFRDHLAARRAPGPGLLQRLATTLLFDGRQQLAMAGVRGADATRYKLLFSTEIADIDLHIEREADDRWWLMGQVMPHALDVDVNALPVQLLSTDREIGAVMTNALGEFKFTGIPAGTYSLTLLMTMGEIELSPIELSN